MARAKKGAPAATAAVEPQKGQMEIAIPDAAMRLRVEYLAHGRIHPDPRQPRVHADDELRASIAQGGVRQPITVRPIPVDALLAFGEACAECGVAWAELHNRNDLMIVDGERRWRGAKGVQESVPAMIRRDQEDAVERLRTQLVANTGKPLTPIEEARGYAQLLERTQMSHEELAKYLGRPRSTISERLRVLETGPWVALVESGELPISHVVQHVLTYASIPDKHHEHVIEQMRKDYRYSRNGSESGPSSISGHDFGSLVEQLYRPLLYPLTKSKTSYAKQPEFDTRDHEQECTCGVIKATLGSGDALRACCGNPEYWRPRHRKALAAKKKDEPKARASSGGRDVRTLYLPEGTKTVSVPYGASEPKGIAFLTDSQGRWELSPYSHAADKNFDPAQLVIDESKLVRLTSSYGGDRVGTRDVAAVKAAREAWRARWAARQAELGRELGAQIAKVANAHEVRGPGAVQLVRVLLLTGDEGLDVLDIACAIGVAVPEELRAAVEGQGYSHRDIAKHAKAWAGTLDEATAGELLTALASAIALGAEPISEQLEAEQKQAVDQILRRRPPWLDKPKAPKGKAAEKEKPIGRYANGDAKETPSQRATKKRTSAAEIAEALDSDEVEDDPNHAFGADDDVEDEGMDLWEAEQIDLEDAIAAEGAP